MMMADDSTPGRPTLPDESVALLREALIAYLAAGETEALDRALRRIAEDAREHRMHAEHLLMALKEVWYALPEIRNGGEHDERERMLQRVVTQCIRAYYAA